MNSSLCHVFVTNTAFVTFQPLGMINNSSRNTCSLLLNIKIFVNDQISVLECFWNLNVCVIHKKQILNIFYLLEFLEISSIFIKNWKEIRQNHWLKSAKCYNALHVPKRVDNVLKVWVCFKTVKCSKTRHATKVCICFKTVKCSKMKKELSKTEGYPSIKV